MKKSKTIPLVMLGIGAAAASGCTPDYNNTSYVEQRQVVQNNYKNRDDCRREWGNDDNYCRSSNGVYMGPRYFYNHAGGTPMVYDSNGNSRALTNGTLSKAGAKSVSSSRYTSTMSFSRPAGVSRGGFGGTARGFSGGG
jgi:hypothetical protein